MKHKRCFLFFKHNVGRSLFNFRTFTSRRPRRPNRTKLDVQRAAIDIIEFSEDNAKKLTLMKEEHKSMDVELEKTTGMIRETEAKIDDIIKNIDKQVNLFRHQLEETTKNFNKQAEITLVKKINEIEDYVNEQKEHLDEQSNLKVKDFEQLINTKSNIFMYYQLVSFAAIFVLAYIYYKKKELNVNDMLNIHNKNILKKNIDLMILENNNKLLLMKNNDFMTMLKKEAKHKKNNELISRIENKIERNNDRIYFLKKEHGQYWPIPGRSVRQGIRQDIRKLQADNNALEAKREKIMISEAQ